MDQTMDTTDELERLRERDRLLRHYLGTIANRVGRPVHWDALFQVGEIEEIGEGVLAEIERLRDADQSANSQP